MYRPALSVVIPCYNEAACLDLLHARVAAAARAAVGDDHEIVLINDGSRDDSWAVMQRLSEQDPRLVAINLSRNHGHQLALTAGLDLCSGEQILIIDADLQDPPELLTDMRATMSAEGADVVYAVRRKREGETIFKKATAAAFYRVLDRVTDTPIPLDTGDFRLMSRRALDALLSLPEQARFIRGMVAWVGFRQVPFPYDRAERHAGAIPDRHARIEADAPLARDGGEMGEAGVGAGIRHLEQRIAADRVRADRLVDRVLAMVDPLRRLEPLPPVVDQRDQRDRGVRPGGRLADDGVEHGFARRVEEPVILQRRQPLGFDLPVRFHIGSPPIGRS